MTHDPRPPEPVIQMENPAFTAWVERYAIDLCTDQDDGHTGAMPCWRHLHNARGEGLAYWRKRGVTFPSVAIGAGP